MDYISLNGQLIPYDDARIAPADAGLLHGAGLFETCRVRNRHIFRIDDHIDRITRSAEELNLPLTLSAAQLRELTDDLLAVNDLTDARLRLTITRGDLHAITPEEPTPPLTLLLTASEFQPYPAALYDKGMTAIISAYKQNPSYPLTGHKTTSYFDRILALQEAQRAQAGEALWFSTGGNWLAEGSISNIFLVDSSGTLMTPPLTVGEDSPEATQRRLCLPGITRKLTLELAIAANHLPHERLLSVNDLLGAQEVFLTNAIMGIMPVTRIERHEVADGTPGPMTRQLMQAYAARLAAECG
jgi:branched-chain amino acid aminotransferase